MTRKIYLTISWFLIITLILSFSLDDEFFFLRKDGDTMSVLLQ